MLYILSELHNYLPLCYNVCFDRCGKLCSIIAVNGTGEIQDFIMRKVYSSFCQADHEWHRIPRSILSLLASYVRKNNRKLSLNFLLKIVKRNLISIRHYYMTISIRISVVEELEERQKFLRDMEAIGQGKQYQTIIQTETSQVKSLYLFCCCCKKGSFYIAQYPVHWTAQSALHFLPSLADLFIPTPTRLLREAF